MLFLHVQIRPNVVWSVHRERQLPDLLELPDIYVICRTDEDVAAMGPLPSVYEVVERPEVFA